MTKIFKAALLGAFLSAAALSACAQTPSSPTPSSHLAGVTGTLASLIGSTTYVHETEAVGAIVTPLGNGTYDVKADCSGWVSHNLEKLAPHYAAVRQYQPQVEGEANHAYPRANVYRQYFANLPAGAPFQRIQRLADVRPGDILAWCLPGHCGIPFTGKPANDTGHVMVVMGTPAANDANSAFLLVLDSSSVTHFAFDDLPEAVRNARPDLGKLYSEFPPVRTTKQSDGKYATSGAGPGFILFGTNPDGSIGSFQFGPGDRTNSEGILFAVGRATPLP